MTSLLLVLASLATALQSQEPRPVAVVRAKREDLSRSVSLVASVRAIRQADIVPRVTGYVKAIPVEEGFSLDADAIIAEIDAPDLQAHLRTAAAMIQEAEAKVEDALAQVKMAQEAVHVAQAEVGARQAEVEVCAADLALQKDRAERRRQLVEQRAATPEEVEEAEGQLLMSVARGEKAKAAVASAEAKVQAAEARLQAAQAAVGSRRAMVDSAQAQYQLAETEVGFATLRNPYPQGHIARRYVDPGALVKNDMTKVVSVMDLSQVRVRMDIPERELPHVRPNVAATIVLDADPDRTMEATLTHLSGAIDPDTRTMPAEIILDNANGELTPGMWCKVQLQVEQRDGSLTLPAAAIRTDGEQPFVWIVADGKAARVTVKLGIDNGIRAEVVAGLHGSEDIVVGNVAGLREGDAIRKSEP
jgi:RND family efflux transporter MFP subunit